MDLGWAPKFAFLTNSQVIAMQVLGSKLEENAIMHLALANHGMMSSHSIPPYLFSHDRIFSKIAVASSCIQEDASDSAVYHLHYFQSFWSQVYSRYKD